MSIVCDETRDDSSWLSADCSLELECKQYDVFPSDDPSRERQPDAISFIAARREPSGVAAGKHVEVPEGSRPAANNGYPYGVNVDGIAR